MCKRCTIIFCNILLCIITVVIFAAESVDNGRRTVMRFIASESFIAFSRTIRAVRIVIFCTPRYVCMYILIYFAADSTLL